MEKADAKNCRSARYKIIRVSINNLAQKMKAKSYQHLSAEILRRIRIEKLHSKDWKFDLSASRDSSDEGDQFMSSGKKIKRFARCD